MPFVSMCIGAFLTVSATAYALLALLVRARTYAIAASLPSAQLAVTVLKPLCGIESHLEENLATLCEQTYPEYQILFGVRDPNDAAIQVVERLKAAYPQHDIELVVDSRVHGTNFKVSNLMNMLERARHPWIVLADSDIAVPPDYLEQVTAPLADAAVGIVTCLYRARPQNAFWSRMGALFIDAWFVPSVRVASFFGGDCFGFGATIAMQADTLAAIGGLESIRNRLADDFWLGKLTRDLGLKTVISTLMVATEVTEMDFSAMWERERRWMLTIRSINPLGYVFSFVTFSFPVLMVGLLLAPTVLNLAIVLVGIVARLIMFGRGSALPARIAMQAPLRDLLLFLVWMSAFSGSTAQWRGQTMQVQDDPAGPAP